jgi:cobalt-zinc-cadmium efflux system protein
MEDKKNQVKSKADFKKALIVGLIMITAQATGGILSNSVAIFADAAHLGSQALGIVVSLSAIRYAETAPD